MVIGDNVEWRRRDSRAPSGRRCASDEGRSAVSTVDEERFCLPASMIGWTGEDDGLSPSSAGQNIDEAEVRCIILQ